MDVCPNSSPREDAETVKAYVGSLVNDVHRPESLRLLRDLDVAGAAPHPQFRYSAAAKRSRFSQGQVNGLNPSSMFTRHGLEEQCTTNRVCGGLEQAKPPDLEQKGNLRRHPLIVDSRLETFPFCCLLHVNRQPDA